MYFKTFMDDHRVITKSDELIGHNVDWLNMVRGSSSVLLKPKTTKEVSQILSYCNERNLAVCPQGLLLANLTLFKMYFKNLKL